jgi:prepilin-type N-terminal cleavage/methylation domain-containing protein
MSKEPQRNVTATQGFSLVELMIALAVLGMIAVGISQNLILTRGFSETGVREVTANAVASGYIEQLKTMEYEVILTSVRDPSTPLPTVLSHGEEDPLMNGKTLSKKVVIDQDADGKTTRTMDLDVRVDIKDLAASNNGRILSIELTYTWKDAKTGRPQVGKLRTMRSYVRTS